MIQTFLDEYQTLFIQHTCDGGSFQTTAAEKLTLSYTGSLWSSNSFISLMCPQPIDPSGSSSNFISLGLIGIVWCFICCFRGFASWKCNIWCKICQTMSLNNVNQWLWYKRVCQKKLWNPILIFLLQTIVCHFSYTQSVIKQSNNRLPKYKCQEWITSLPGRKCHHTLHYFT